MNSKKEELLAKKLAEVDALKKEIEENASGTLGSRKATKKRKVGLKTKLFWSALALFVGLPALISTISVSTMSPEKKAELLEVQKSEKISGIVKRIEAARDGSRYDELIREVEELRKISPQQASIFEAELRSAEDAIAEEQKLRELNSTGDFYIGSYVDEFGEGTGDKFVGYKGRGTFSNSATQDSKLDFWIALNNPKEFDIALYEYAGDNPVKDVFGGDTYIIRFRHADETGQVTCRNYSDRISCGPENAAKLHAALKSANQVKFLIVNQNTTSSQYSFSVNANGYSNAMRLVGEEAK